jgi:4-amino-4-deoxy-L-arabinose transferase-like glycosyltransferase
MPHSAQRLRKFRFNRPQQIAAVMLAILLAQCLWVIHHDTLTDTDYAYARCGREMWQKPSPLAGYFTTCGNIHDGTLAYRAAGLPLTLERVFAGQLSTTSTWEMRHELHYINLFLRLPFTFAALALGACLWWVTRRLYGNTGGYIALGLYCFSPPIIAIATTPNNEIWAALALFAAVYLAIGVAHALQGPRKKWRPRILLLTVVMGVLSAAHVTAYILALIFAVAFIAYVAEHKRAYLPTLLILWVLGPLFILFAFYTFRPDAFSYVFRSDAARIGLSLEPARNLFSSLPNAGITIATLAAIAFYAAVRRARYFGNTAPLIVAAVLFVLISKAHTSSPGRPYLWAVPFLLTFVAGAFADILEARHRRYFVWITVALLVAQAALCLAGLPLLAN